MKKAPSEAIYYAAYTHYDGDILVALKYKALSERNLIIFYKFNASFKWDF